MLNHQQSSTSQLASRHAHCVDQLDGLQPEFRVAITPLDVNVRRFRPFIAEKEERAALGQEHW